MNCKTKCKKKCEVELPEDSKNLDVPTDGILLIKTDDLDEEQMEAIKKGLEEKHGFKGSIICIPTNNDMYFLSQIETNEVVKDLIEKIDTLTKKVEGISGVDQNKGVSQADVN